MLQFKEDLDRKVGAVTITQSKLEKTTAAVDDALRTCTKDVVSVKHDLASVKANVDKCVKNVEENTGNIFGCKQDFDLLKDNLGKNKIVYLNMGKLKVVFLEYTSKIRYQMFQISSKKLWIEDLLQRSWIRKVN